MKTCLKLPLAWALAALIAFSPSLALAQTMPQQSAGLANLSVRLTVAPGEPGIAGLTVRGTMPRTVLIRAIGPGLAAFGVGNTLPNPTIEFYRAGETTPFFRHNDWVAPGGAPASSPIRHIHSVTDMQEIARMLGAFPVTDSRDCAIAVDLAPGSYSFHVKSEVNANDRGAVHVEVFELGF